MLVKLTLVSILILFSSLSFFAYSLSYFLHPHMKSEFRRFNLEKVGLLAVVLQLLGASGLIVGLRINPILIISSGGLATLMLLGLVVRVRLKDSLVVSIPALVLCVVNGYICLKALVLL
jgi:hypothetical protein